MSLPSLPPKLELVVLLVGVAAGYNLTMQILPRERIDLAQLEAEERTQRPAVFPAPLRSPQLNATQQTVPVQSVEKRSMFASGESCAIPPGGGPALNQRFEPC
ncbi:putative uncharacterized conserved secreted protein [Synechococcus sp. BIOS-E4-1]|uniref:hypothetical protein n=1 Tax=Synechococcus sp. BIOS-E4-1 TaxID=1400864 RepID=UPI001646BF86|nr:hypothetical protein [Synechococcus sp. BIOS-E4-1]QNI53061.1 putative uncharacterized conserved secreted protein [Synechococcus sp. BIOS-E4-1]